MAASFGVRYFADPPKPAPGKKFAEVSLEGETPVRIAYKEFGQSVENEPPVVMIHGSPGSAEAFDGLASVLPNRHIISVDLPGFGDSTHDIPDYSIAAHAKYLQAFLKNKKINNAHLVGFSLGGGVILHVADNEPDLAKSITFISSIGVQEYELFGDFHVNHAVHGLQLGFAYFLQELTPHFGVFDGGMIEYSRNFYDTDQRPLRTILLKTQQAFLIIHGKDDPLVPVEAAREHARLVPQSEYQELDDNHFFVFMRPQKTAGLLRDFWKKVEGGDAVLRNDSRKDRINAAAAAFEFEIFAAKGPVIFCFFLLILVSALINQDLPAVMAGVFIAQGRFGPVMPLIAIVVAIVIGSIIWRRIGRRRRGITMKSFFPFSIDPRKAAAFGFGFLDCIKRSRDSFIEFALTAIGLRILKTISIGAVTCLATFGAVFYGFIGNSNTLNLMGLALLVFLSKAFGSYFLGLRRRP